MARRRRAADPAPETGPGTPTGSLSLDLLLGTGGWPRGRIVELYGPEGSGKTTLALEAVAEAVRAGGSGAIIDADHGISADAAARLGVDLSEVPFVQSNALEEVFIHVEELVNGGTTDVIVLDSIASLVESPKQGCRDVPPPPKNERFQHAIDYYLRALLGPLSRSRACLLVTNQMREKIGVMYGNLETTPWVTHPLRDHASVRVDLRKVTTLKEGDRATGWHVRARVVKSRLAVPMDSAEFDIAFATGIDRTADLLAAATKAGVITRVSGRRFLGEEPLGNSEGAVISRLNEDPDLAERVRAEVLARHAPAAE